MYGTYISQLVRIGRICDRYEDFIERHRILDYLIRATNINLCSYFKRFSGKYKDIFNKFKITHTCIKDGIPLSLNTVGNQDMMSWVIGFLNFYLQVLIF